MAETSRESDELPHHSIAVPFFKSFLEGLRWSIKETLAGLVLAVLVAVYQWKRGSLSQRAFKENAWEVITPWLWLVCGLVSIRILKTFLLLNNKFKANPSWSKDVPKYRLKMLGTAVMLIFLLSLLCYLSWHVAITHEPEKGWCYAFLYHKFPMGMEPKLHLGLVNPSSDNLHNIDVYVREIDDPNRKPGEANRERDLEMFNMRGTTLSIVHTFSPTKGSFSDTGLSYNWFVPIDVFEITIIPEDGDTVKEYLRFGMDWQCVVKIIREKDGKVLKENVLPQLDMWGRRGESEWKGCLS